MRHASLAPDWAAPTPAAADRESLLTIVFAFLCFFPYPALATGATSGLQLNHIMALAMLPLIALGRLPWRQLSLFTALMCCLLVSGYASLLWQSGVIADLVFKSFIVIAVATVVMIPGGYLARAGNLAAFAIGASLAILVHAGVGLYQVYSFGQSAFPFLGIYRNPAFYPIENVAMDYALYIRRPFGLFPEPSAMVSSLGPWLILLMGLLLHRDIRSRLPGLGRWLVALALAGGVPLLLGARSGYAPLWVACALPILIVYPIASAPPGRTRSLRGIVMTMLGATLLLIAAIFAQGQLGSDAAGDNDSWQARQQSIVIGIAEPSRDLFHFLFGFGPGQSATYLQQSATIDLLPAWYTPSSIEPVYAVWSVLGTLYMETGLLGLAVMIAIAVVTARAIAHSSARLLGVCVFGAWLAGVTMTTSYFPLSPIWLMLAVLLGWDKLFEPTAPAALATGSGVPSPAPMYPLGGGVAR